MPKVKMSLFSQLNNYVSEFGPEVFSTDGKLLYCKICDISNVEVLTGLMLPNI